MYKYKGAVLSDEEEKALFGYNWLEEIPPEMASWNLDPRRPRLESLNPGQYVLVGVEQAWIEQHHQVEILDESGDPLPGVWVIFGFPGGEGPRINLKPKPNRWVESPAVLIGNAQRTNRMGYAQHTFGSGGEDIWVWDVQADGLLELPSWIIKNCTWVAAPVAGAWSLHTGVKLIFQRRREDVEPRGPRLDRLDNTLKALESKIEALQSGQDLAVHLDSIRGDLKSLKETQSLALENLKLRVELLEIKVASLIS